MIGVSQIILDAYREGIFPMAESADDESFAFYRPYMRGLLPIKTLHIPSKLLKILRGNTYTVTVNKAFHTIIDGCAAQSPKRSKTWINRPIRDMFIQLHKDGYAYSIEVWDEKGHLIGGLYGLSIGAVFCGESMVSFAPNGSKIALVHLCALLWQAGYTVLDTQFINPHLMQFGAYEMPQEDYEALIAVEMEKKTANISIMQPGKALLNTYLAARTA